MGNEISEASIKSSEKELMKSSDLQIIPLGGLGEFGMNMMAYRIKGEMILVDCGSTFPDPSLLGIDLVIPDMSFVIEHKDEVKALFLTHGHEDHIGAVPYLFQDLNVPIYGTRFTLELLRNKFSEHQTLGKPQLNPIVAGDNIDIGAFSISFLHVNHSICQSVSLALKTAEGLIVHTGDFKIDSTPTDGEVFDYAGFAELGQKGVLALLSDSTNIERKGFTNSEKDVTKELDTLFNTSEGAIFISLFSSSIPRISEVIKLAEKYGRRIHIAGRSLINSTEIARDIGLLKIDQSMIVDAKAISWLPREEILVILTGSQGEPRSVLTRVAMDDHKEIRVEKDDTVILSARIIPGHERSVSNIVNHLAMRGAEIYYEHNHAIHSSGHAYRGELATMLNLTKPEFFIPLHGEYNQLETHRKLAIECGVDEEKAILAQSGDVVSFKGGRASLIGQVASGRVFVDGKGVGDVSPEEIRERRKISQTGMVVAILVINKKTGEVIYGPDLISRGFIFEDVSEKLFDDAKRAVLKMLEDMSFETKTDLMEVKEEMRLLLRRHFNKALSRKPVVLPLVMDM